MKTTTKKKNKLGNPAVALVAAETAVKVGSNKQVQAVAKNTFLVLALGVASYFGYKEYRKWVVKKYLIAHGHEPQVIAAMQMYKAMFSDWTIPIPFSSITIPYDGTNETVLYNIARTYGNFQEIATAYNKIFSSALMSDIRSELNSDEFQTFVANLNALAISTDVQNADFTALNPYQVGETLFANDSNTIMNVAEYNNGTYTKGAVYDKYSFAEKIGEIKFVLINEEEQRITYLIDIPYNVFTDGLIDHRHVLNNKP